MSLACQLGCPPERCDRRATLSGGGWTCTWLTGLGVLDPATQTADAPPASHGAASGVETAPAPGSPASHAGGLRAARDSHRVPGWSRGAVLPCPVCGCRAYSPGPAGLPGRRCWACDHVFDPEAAEVAARRA